MVRTQLTHENVQKSMSTTLPRRSARVSGVLLSQPSMPVKSGAVVALADRQHLAAGARRRGRRRRVAHHGEEHRGDDQHGDGRESEHGIGSRGLNRTVRALC